MGDKTAIEWTNATWNPFVGCTHISAGCDHCYAARQSAGRLRNTPTYQGLTTFGRFNGTVRLLPERMTEPLRWKHPRMIFVNSMSDMFHDKVPDEYIATVYVTMARAGRHTFQVLTKRHGRMRSLLSSPRWPELLVQQGWPSDLDPEQPLPNVWLGVSVEDQHWADIRIPVLLDTPAAVRFLSCEPLLGPVDLFGTPDTGECSDYGPAITHEARSYRVEYGTGTEWDCEHQPGIDWVIAGGESGTDARPMHPAWARSLRDQCVSAGVPFLFKQWGEFLPVPVYDDPKMSGGRAYAHPEGGAYAAVIREHAPGKSHMRGATVRPLEPGDRVGAGLMIDRDTFALKVGKLTAGRLLDGRTWDEYPERVTADAS